MHDGISNLSNLSRRHFLAGSGVSLGAMALGRPMSRGGAP